jgi:hypothetical protein
MLSSRLASTKPFGLFAIFAFAIATTVLFCDVASAESPGDTPVAYNGLLGDVNQDGLVDFGDVPAFIEVLINGAYHPAADLDQNCEVNFFDIPLFISPGLTPL